MDKDVILRQELSELDTQDIQQLMDGSGAFGDTTIDDIINSAADGSSIWGSSLMSGKTYKTIVVNEALLVDVPGTICYVSEGVKVTGKSEAVTENTDTSYILYE